MTNYKVSYNLKRNGHRFDYSIQFDGETDLPLLPEGHYWRVGPNNSKFYTGTRVDIVRKRKRLWDKVVRTADGSYEFYRDKRKDLTYEEFIRERAVDVWFDTYGEYKVPSIKDHYGNYPPRKLGGK